MVTAMTKYRKYMVHLPRRVVIKGLKVLADITLFEITLPEIEGLHLTSALSPNYCLRITTLNHTPLPWVFATRGITAFV